ncbi:hypothetical protein [Streptomyces antibioticus]|uniref:hypothetical protein n=1 Tax=Streptomyces antibioticus TaxID=1890 RepID=UPI0036AB7F62
MEDPARSGDEAVGAVETADVPVPPVPVVPPRRRRRGRTTLMIVGAAVLGVVAGTCAGYLVQADREPTALPPLSQPVVKQAKGEAEPLSAAQDRKVKMDGDLRKLLLSRPKGARENDYVPADGWLNLAEYAAEFTRPSQAFDNLVDGAFRRAAVTSWQVGETYQATIVLVQFRQDDVVAASGWAENGHYWDGSEDDTRSWPLPKTGDGMVYVHDTPDREPGYLPLYSARAHAWRGDVYVDISICDSKPIPKAKIMDLAVRQMGKL